ncbi:DivIVA domain-containing protein [Corynebacterium spheniscorum]|uniref:Cell division septum initiation DivIVA, interacts with FtsZ, MinD n=1 Tax=Corynebacterium spheniscorum TaxID=185761 RepID=A0A1I2RI87_9CORY|nr:DivIVA domain-containing protein [Corynebacterium spheniscorum]KAA8722608.1 DivIVA domain-containing protein [Corynebacterium spheniscorum]SFG37486.1 Cell division septum initiation DivIVA, interacts with FtsZ, MinD [Corynebacterium spheniscorum]
MYRVFEALDELVQTVEQAYGVPMTSNCVVPRSHVLALLDDLRNALPIEIDDAQDVLDERDELLRGAEERARSIVDEAQQQADDLVRGADAEAQRLVADATTRSDSMIAQAEDRARMLNEQADRDSTAMVDRARAESERLIAEGNDSYQRSIDEGLAEQRRLVEESEVVRRANDEARRVVDAAHADSRQLRGECDDFVDSKLAEFEESLSNILRTVGRDRQALRRGAGAAGLGDESYR